MAAPPLMRSLSTRSVKKLEKPRPLKISASQSKISSEPSPRVPLQDLMVLVESVSQHLIDKNFDENIASNIAFMHAKLKVHGQQLETIYKDQLDRAFAIFRDGCQDDGLICTARLHLLELVELRANQWSNCDNTLIYYTTKMASSEIEPIVMTPTLESIASSVPSPPMPPVLGPGEILKNSGKFPKPTKIPGKNYCKDEVVIRNSDSGKVMGIKGRRVHMIEELSETIISFQRVEVMRPMIIKSPITYNSARYLYPPHFFRPYSPQRWLPPPHLRSGCIVNPGAKERLVQITGPSEDKILHAKQLMEETIRRNASPVREGHDRHGRDIGGSSSSLNSSASDESNRQSGSRRSILHSYSTNDASLGEYKFTIVLGNDTVKITGTNYETVRNARLVLEEYYNTWLQKNCIGDCYGIEDDVFAEPIADMTMLRLNSVDSGNGNGPSTSSGDSDDITCISAVPTPAANIDPVLSYHDYPITQPERRPVLGRTNSIPSPQNQVEVCRKYSRAFLLECALSHHSKVTPPNWDQVLLEFPAIAKKAGSPFDPKAFAKRVTSTTIGTNEPNSEGEWN